MGLGLQIVHTIDIKDSDVLHWEATYLKTSALTQNWDTDIEMVTGQPACVFYREGTDVCGPDS